MSKKSKAPEIESEVEEINQTPRTQSVDDIKETLAITEDFLLGNLIKAVSAPFKELQIPFRALSEMEQATLLTRIAETTKEAVIEAVRCISSGDRTNFRATCDQVLFKSDGVKGTLSLFNTPEAHELADYAGKTIMIVIEDGSRYLNVGDATRGEADQKPLFDKSQELESA
jgi:hypothetical protein